MELSSLGHCAFGAGVTVIIVEVSNVGVKVGMVGSGVTDAVEVVLGINVSMLVGTGEGVFVDVGVRNIGATVLAGTQAVRTKIPFSRAITVGFNVYLATLRLIRFDYY